jgi:hypothetical protein
MEKYKVTFFLFNESKFYCWIVSTHTVLHLQRPLRRCSTSLAQLSVCHLTIQHIGHGYFCDTFVEVCVEIVDCITARNKTCFHFGFGVML